MLAQEVRITKWQGKYLLVKYKLLKDELGDRFTVELLDIFEELKDAQGKKKLYEFVFKRNQEELAKIRKAVNKYVQHHINGSNGTNKKVAGKV